jgi:site-specific recombinase XerD
MREIDVRLTKCQAGDAANEHRQRTVAHAVERFLDRCGVLTESGYKGDLEYGTFRKYRNALHLFAAFCEGRAIRELTSISLADLEDYRRTRDIGPVTWKVELQTLRTFFTYCVRHKWIVFSPANDLRAPRNLKPNQIVPYTLREEDLILAASSQIGGGKYNRSGMAYEQLRARTMVMLLRSSALRVSDVATFRRDAVSWDDEKKTWRALLRTQKSGEPVYLPIPEALKMMLDAIPLPRNAPWDCPYYFWNGQTSRRAVIGIAERTLAAVFKKSGVKDAHAHRFRHTLATRLLGAGATYEQVADILGNSPAVVRKHYGKWSKGRQENIDRLMFAHFAGALDTAPVTLQSHEKMTPVN